MFEAPPYLFENRTDSLTDMTYCIDADLGLHPEQALQAFVLNAKGFLEDTTSTDGLEQTIVYMMHDPVGFSTDHPLQKEFSTLIKQWEEDTFAVSSSTKIYAHPSYQRIIAMGREGIPLVLRELEQKGGRWFYALKFMAGEEGNNVAAGLTTYKEARAAWLEWGYRNSYL